MKVERVCALHSEEGKDRVFELQGAKVVGHGIGAKSPRRFRVRCQCKPDIVTVTNVRSNDVTTDRC